jgi:hypothetical protein
MLSIDGGDASVLHVDAQPAQQRSFNSSNGSGRSAAVSSIQNVSGAPARNNAPVAASSASANANNAASSSENSGSDSEDSMVNALSQPVDRRRRSFSNGRRRASRGGSVATSSNRNPSGAPAPPRNRNRNNAPAASSSSANGSNANANDVSFADRNASDSEDSMLDSDLQPIPQRQRISSNGSGRSTAASTTRNSTGAPTRNNALAASSSTANGFDANDASDVSFSGDRNDSESEDTILDTEFRPVRQRTSSNGEDEPSAASTNRNRSRAPAPPRNRHASESESNPAERPSLQLGSFVDIDTGEIRSREHGRALRRLLRLAANAPGGILGALGHGNRTGWINDNIGAFFAEGGPFQAFNPVMPRYFLRQLGTVETRARGYYGRDHSNDATGSQHENIPRWARAFFPYFEAMTNRPTNNARTAAARRERSSVAASLTGRQAPLGARNEDGPAQLRNETTRNNGNPGVRAQIIGNVDAETRYDDDEYDAGGDDFREGRDDVFRRRTAPRQRTINGIRHRNVHVDFGPDGNDPSSRFTHFVGAYSSLEVIARSFQQAMVPSRTVEDLSNAFDETLLRYDRATTEQGRRFHQSVLDELDAELAELRRMRGTTTLSGNVSVGNATDGATVSGGGIMENAYDGASENHSTDTH